MKRKSSSSPLFKKPGEGLSVKTFETDAEILREVPINTCPVNGISRDEKTEFFQRLPEKIKRWDEL